MVSENSRVQTGIKGLDEAMLGGFIQNSTNLLSGGPGSGKSILAMQFLINGAEKSNEPGAYVTFEETKESLFNNMKNFGWDLEKLEKKGKIVVMNLSPVDMETSPLDSEKGAEKAFGLKYKLVKKMKIKRIVVDSVTAFSMLYPDEVSKRKGYLALVRMLRDWECTSILINEHDPEDNKYSPLDFEVDGIVRLYNIKKEYVRTRALEIYKMRGTSHSTKTFAMEITNEGIKVYPKQTVL